MKRRRFLPISRPDHRRIHFRPWAIIAHVWAIKGASKVWLEYFQADDPWTMTHQNYHGGNLLTSELMALEKNPTTRPVLVSSSLVRWKDVIIKLNELHRTYFRVKSTWCDVFHTSNQSNRWHIQSLERTDCVRLLSSLTSGPIQGRYRIFCDPRMIDRVPRRRSCSCIFYDRCDNFRTISKYESTIMSLNHMVSDRPWS